jgi:hypothetical protein
VILTLDNRRPDPRMDRLPNSQIHPDHSPRLDGVARPGDRHIEAVTSARGSNESTVLQKLLQVTHEAWSIDVDVQAAVAPRSCRNGVASLTVIRMRAASRVKCEAKARIEAG